MGSIQFTGNVGSVDLRFTASGRAVCTVSVAENHRRKDQNGQWVDDGVTWRRVAFWERKAEAVADEIAKGDMVIVTGDERLREFEGKDGTTRQSLEVNGREIGKLVLPKRNDQQKQGGFQQSQPQSQGGWGQQPQSNDPWAGGGQQQGQEPPF